jgi:hypothetical protein
MEDEKLLEVLWRLALSDHLGDVAEAIKPIVTHFKMESTSLDHLRDEMKRLNILPDYARD